MNGWRRGQAYVTVDVRTDLHSVQLSRHLPEDDLSVWIRGQFGFALALPLADAIWLATALPKILAVADEVVKDAGNCGTLAEIAAPGETVNAEPPGLRRKGASQ